MSDGRVARLPPGSASVILVVQARAGGTISETMRVHAHFELTIQYGKCNSQLQDFRRDANSCPLNLEMIEILPYLYHRILEFGHAAFVLFRTCSDTFVRECENFISFRRCQNAFDFSNTDMEIKKTKSGYLFDKIASLSLRFRKCVPNWHFVSNSADQNFLNSSLSYHHSRTWPFSRQFSISRWLSQRRILIVRSLHRLTRPAMRWATYQPLPNLFLLQHRHDSQLQFQDQEHALVSSFRHNHISV